MVGVLFAVAVLVHGSLLLCVGLYSSEQLVRALSRAVRPAVGLAVARLPVRSFPRGLAATFASAVDPYPRRHGVAEVQWCADGVEAADVDARVVFVPSGGAVAGVPVGSAAASDLSAAAVGSATLVHVDGALCRAASCHPPICLQPLGTLVAGVMCWWGLCAQGPHPFSSNPHGILVAGGRHITACGATTPTRDRPPCHCNSTDAEPRGVGCVVAAQASAWWW